MLSPFDIPADLDTPVSAFLKLRSFRPRFLLESVENGERLGRYSFLGFGDAVEVRQAAPAPAPGTGAPGSLLSRLRTALVSVPRLAPAPPEVPFTGGLVGVAGYGAARDLEPGARARPAPDLPDAAFLAPVSLLVFDHLTRRVALLHDGSEPDRLALRRDVVAALRGHLPPEPRPGRHAKATPSLTADEFHDRVARVQEWIRAGDIYQLVLSIRFSGATDVAPFEAYRALRLLNPSPYMYFFDFDDFSVAGTSPEALVALRGRRAALRPIAGTRPRSPDPRVDRDLERELLADPKETAEHVMLVDLARNDLGRVAVTGSVEVKPYRSVERYSHVMHLVSGVEGVLRPEADAFDLFGAAFPAGTVVGAPKRRAMDRIEEIEPVPRGLYAGTVGYFGATGGMDQAIAIRTLVFQKGEYRYQAGAGIVADSVAEREHAEILSKGAALESALSLAGEGL